MGPVADHEIAIDLREDSGRRLADGGVRDTTSCAEPDDGIPHSSDYAASDFTPKWGGAQDFG